MTELIAPTRRGFLTGLGAALITAPAIVRAGSLMPVKALPSEFWGKSIHDLPGAYWASPADVMRHVQNARKFIQADVYTVSPFFVTLREFKVENGLV